jgi:hypothetical protein
MEHLFVVLALALTLLMVLTACGSKRTPTPVPTPGLPYVEDLQAALLTTSDLPAGWTAQPVRTSNELSTLPCGQTLPDVQMLTATATFQTANGAHLSESLAAYHPGDAEMWLTALQTGPACAMVNEGEYQGTPIVARVTQPDAPALGDQSFALRLISDGPSGTLMTDLVYVRIGDFILQIGDTTVGAADSDLTATIVQQAVLDIQAAKLTP